MRRRANKTHKAGMSLSKWLSATATAIQSTDSQEYKSLATKGGMHKEASSVIGVDCATSPVTCFLAIARRVQNPQDIANLRAIWQHVASAVHKPSTRNQYAASIAKQLPVNLRQAWYVQRGRPAERASSSDDEDEADARPRSKRKSLPPRTYEWSEDLTRVIRNRWSENLKQMVRELRQNADVREDVERWEKGTPSHIQSWVKQLVLPNGETVQCQGDVNCLQHLAALVHRAGGVAADQQNVWAVWDHVKKRFAGSRHEAAWAEEIERSLTQGHIPPSMGAQKDSSSKNVLTVKRFGWSDAKQKAVMDAYISIVKSLVHVDDKGQDVKIRGKPVRTRAFEQTLVDHEVRGSAARNSLLRQAIAKNKVLNDSKNPQFAPYNSWKDVAALIFANAIMHDLDRVQKFLTVHTAFLRVMYGTKDRASLWAAAQTKIRTLALRQHTNDPEDGNKQDIHIWVEKNFSRPGQIIDFAVATAVRQVDAKMRRPVELTMKDVAHAISVLVKGRTVYHKLALIELTVGSRLTENSSDMHTTMRALNEQETGQLIADGWIASEQDADKWIVQEGVAKKKRKRSNLVAGKKTETKYVIKPVLILTAGDVLKARESVLKYTKEHYAYDPLDETTDPARKYDRKVIPLIKKELFKNLAGSARTIGTHFLREIYINAQHHLHEDHPKLSWTKTVFIKTFLGHDNNKSAANYESVRIVWDRKYKTADGMIRGTSERVAVIEKQMAMLQKAANEKSLVNAAHHVYLVNLDGEEVQLNRFPIMRNLTEQEHIYRLRSAIHNLREANINPTARVLRKLGFGGQTISTYLDRAMRA
jgi:hypothetical protein